VLERALEIAQNLPLDRKNSVDVRQIQFHIAICYFFQHEVEQAKAELLTLITSHSVTDENAIQILEATHIFAEIYFLTKDFDEAIVHGRRSMIGRRKMFGSSHRAYYDSLRLLSKIYSAKGDLIESKIYRDLVGAGARRQAARRRNSTSLLTNDKMIDDVRNVLSGYRSNKFHEYMSVNIRDPRLESFCSRTAMEAAIGAGSDIVAQALLRGWKQRQHESESAIEQVARPLNQMNRLDRSPYS
jgi:hypothetical protein